MQKPELNFQGKFEKEGEKIYEKKVQNNQQKYINQDMKEQKMSMKLKNIRLSENKKVVKSQRMAT